MKKSLLSIRGILTALTMTLFTLATEAAAWNFATLSDTDRTNLNADTGNWSYDSSKKRWGNTKSLSATTLMANGQELEFTKGLLLSAQSSDQIRKP